MNRETKINLKRLERELLAQEPTRRVRVYNQELGPQESQEYDEYEDDYEDALERMGERQRFWKLLAMAIFLTLAILAVLGYWLVRFGGWQP